MRLSEAEFARLQNRGQRPAGNEEAVARATAIPRASLAHRGEAFEDEINAANSAYMVARIAHVYKVPTPARPINKDGKVILIRQKSSVDYLGTWAGRGLALEAKSTKEGRWPLSLIEPHQVQFLLDWDACGGVAGLLLRFEGVRATYWLPIGELLGYLERAAKGGRKSLSLGEMPDQWKIPSTHRAPVDYLAVIERVRDSA